MIYFLLSILCSTGIYVVFTYFGRFKIDTFPAIVVNYMVAAIFGFIYATTSGHWVNPAPGPTLWTAVLIGTLFIGLFYLIAVSSQTHGVAVTSIATKISMVLPVAYFVLADAEEKFSALKAAGILLGCMAVWFTASKEHTHSGVGHQWHIPIILFVGSGILDLALALVQKNFLESESAYRSFAPLPFLVAFLFGGCILAWQVARGQTRLRPRSILGGLVLGLINYGSIFFLLKMLGSGLLERSSAIPINNLGIVGLSALAGIVILKERFSTRGKLGILLALISITVLLLDGRPL